MNEIRVEMIHNGWLVHIGNGSTYFRTLRTALAFVRQYFEERMASIEAVKALRP